MNFKKPSSLHHFKMIYTEFRLFFELIQSDYQFDSENKKQVLIQLEKALSLFKQEIKNLEKSQSHSTMY